MSSPRPFAGRGKWVVEPPLAAAGKGALAFFGLGMRRGPKFFLFFTMQIKIFTIPIHDDGSALEEMNRFLRGNRVLEVEQYFRDHSAGAAWCFCVQYLAGRNPGAGANRRREKKVDYKEVLDEATFNRFSRMRVPKTSHTKGRRSAVEGGAKRVIRGGSWNNSPRNCRVANRNNNTPDNRNNNVGFRVVSSQLIDRAVGTDSLRMDVRR